VVLKGEKTVMQLCREHSLSDSLIHNWKKFYREKGAAAFTVATHARTTPASSQERELLALQNKVAELERLIGHWYYVRQKLSDQYAQTEAALQPVIEKL
jgi:transposase-like protein